VAKIVQLMGKMVTRYPGAGAAVAGNGKLTGLVCDWCVDFQAGKGGLLRACSLLVGGIAGGSREGAEGKFVSDFMIDVPGLVMANLGDGDTVRELLGIVEKRCRLGVGFEGIGTYVRMAVEPLASRPCGDNGAIVQGAFLSLICSYLEVVKFLNLSEVANEDISEQQKTAVRESSVHLAPICNGFIGGVGRDYAELPGSLVLGRGLGMVVNYLVASTPTPTKERRGIKEEEVKEGVFLPAVDGLKEGLRRVVGSRVFETSLDAVFGNRDSGGSKDDHEGLVVSVVRGVCALGGKGEVADATCSSILSKIKGASKIPSKLPPLPTYHVLILLTQHGDNDGFSRNLAYNLLATLAPGYENVADFVMENFLPPPLSGFLQRELRSTKRRSAQLMHSMCLHGTGLHKGSGPFGLSTLKETLGVKEREVRRSEERSDELTATILATRTAQACTSIQDAPPPTNRCNMSHP